MSDRRKHPRIEGRSGPDRRSFHELRAVLGSFEEIAALIRVSRYDWEELRRSASFVKAEDCALQLLSALEKTEEAKS